MATTWIRTDFGTFRLSASHRGLTELRLTEKLPPQNLVSTNNEHLATAVTQLQEYFAGKREQFTVAFDWSEATEFHRGVWSELVKIPYARTVSYQYIAERLGDKNAIRAVGQANRRNPIAIMVPCHRVIAKSGDLQGYFYGLDFKRRLLALENPRSFGEQGSLF
ncbi:methylated-DNA--[protein]-cysteine S-methyltransferase [Lewinella sp. W8]|uniref:methylated-DNA--[protein]-cysteine S-methyltransferase n=1 Tax=Lewinella sp. W8 TaxID=2528208 RepID=UPI001067E638|nr:methylated-DNA--[protein]-cysteine S-methyltransferase [Lewinella sp. W8]MTB53134.1 methylated-DNA--[protein]-cysteine S-methyltransferase [Lewinella sp. W8]